jgi:hypothetical protein
MSSRRLLNLAGATVALVLVLSAAALAAGTTVSVRVEGAKRALLAPTVVHTHAGFITKGGTPEGTCPATSAAGALDVATKHRWNGSYSQFGLGVTSILGEKHPLTASSKYYWGIWVDNKYASSGVCGLKLHKGEHLLFAAAPSSGSTPSPTAIQAPRTGTTTSPFKVHVVYYTAAGKPKPLAKARVSDGKSTAITNAAGNVTIHPASAGKYRFTASEKGYIRPVPATVKVS